MKMKPLQKEHYIREKKARTYLLASLLWDFLTVIIAKTEISQNHF